MEETRHTKARLAYDIQIGVCSQCVRTCAGVKRKCGNKLAARIENADELRTPIWLHHGQTVDMQSMIRESATLPYVKHS